MFTHNNASKKIKVSLSHVHEVVTDKNGNSESGQRLSREQSYFDEKILFFIQRTERFLTTT